MRLTTCRRRIYFDGFLPPAKLSTRLKRLESQTKQLIEYYHTHSIPCRLPSETYENASQSIFGGQTPRPALSSLPPPPFLVPAILEAFKDSKHYNDMIEVVPGEADLYCAKYVKRHGGVVLTGDSDLLVHNLGSGGAVSFFKDVEVSSDGKSGSLHTQIYQSAGIAERLGLPKSHGLLPLAFEMFMDNHGTFPKLVSQAISLKAIKAQKKMYQEFCKEYILLDAESEGKVPGLNAFQFLDPRTSEIVLQFPALAKLAGQYPAAGTPNQDTPHMFLPVLLDCPIRTSAWEMSTSLRQLSYGLINLIVPEDQQRFTVFEHRRQQKNARGREWQLPSLSEIPDACMAVVNLFTKLEKSPSEASADDTWLAAAICQDMELSASRNKIPLSQIFTEQLFDLRDQTRYHNNCTWDIIHFLAQIQGSFYSFRILKQILGLLLSHDDAPFLPDAVRQLNNRLQSLPGFCSVPDQNRVTSLYQKIEKSGMLKLAREIVGIEDPAPVASVEISTKAPRKKRKRKGGVVLSEPSTSKIKSKNPFELLGQE